MAQAKCTDAEFVRLWKLMPTVAQMAATLKVDARNIYNRRDRLIAKGYVLDDRANLVTTKPGKQRIEIEIENGTIMVGSDCHYWPNEVSAAHRGFVMLAKQIRPWGVILNGDILDGASIGRHPRIGWETRPTMEQELDAVRERCEEIRQATLGSRFFRTHGNHDMRFDSILASKVPEMQGVEGFALDQQLPDWQSAFSIRINGHTIITHRIKNGIHATWTSTGDAQINTVTGHLHALRVTPRTTMSPLNGGNIYGVDTGTMADIFGPQFVYAEDGPRNWRSGFAVLTIVDGMLMPPETAMVPGPDQLFFRGERHYV
jgi:predicted phosphodiesterase